MVRSTRLYLLCSETSPRKLRRAAASFARAMCQPGEVRRTDVDDLALLNQQLHRLPDLFPRRVAIDVVHLVKVDVVGLEAPQAPLARGADVPGRQVILVRPLAHLAVHLGGEHDLLAPAAPLREPAADDLLGHALALLPPVDVGGVEEVDPQLQRAIHDRERVGFGRFGTEVHRAEAEPTDLQTCPTELDVAHAAKLAAPRRRSMNNFAAHPFTQSTCFSSTTTSTRSAWFFITWSIGL